MRTRVFAGSAVAIAAMVLGSLLWLALAHAQWTSSHSSAGLVNAWSQTGDMDGDGVPDSPDNCPAWPNADQSLPPWPVPADDPDCDAWSTDDENSIGTDPLLACGAGAWPPDTYEDHLVDSQDMVALLPGLFKSAGQDGYSARLDIFQPGSIIDSQDLVVMLPYLFKSCQPPP